MTLAENQSLGESYDQPADQKVEKLVTDIAGVIRSVAPEKRGELKELAEALFHDEIRRSRRQPPRRERQPWHSA